MPDHRNTLALPCAARGCPDVAAASGYCVSHGDLVWRFHQWLHGDARYAVLSFDRNRAGLEHRTWRPV